MNDSRDEVGVSDYMQLMKAFLDGSLDARAYTRSFRLVEAMSVHSRRRNVPNHASKPTVMSDDFEADDELRPENQQWITEAQLKDRVANLIASLRWWDIPGDATEQTVGRVR